MQTNIERLRHLILVKDTFLAAENEELNSLLVRLEPQEIPADLTQEVADIINMMFLTNNVEAKNAAHLERIQQHMTQRKS
jgi:hypothetical protein